MSVLVTSATCNSTRPTTRSRPRAALRPGTIPPGRPRSGPRPGVHPEPSPVARRPPMGHPGTSPSPFSGMPPEPWDYRRPSDRPSPLCLGPRGRRADNLRPSPFCSSRSPTAAGMELGAGGVGAGVRPRILLRHLGRRRAGPRRHPVAPAPLGRGRRPGCPRADLPLRGGSMPLRIIRSGQTEGPTDLDPGRIIVGSSKAGG